MADRDGADRPADREPEGDRPIPDDDRPGADMGVAYDRALAEDEAVADEADASPGPGVGEVFRSGS
jgi:hypothetical protein